MSTEEPKEPKLIDKVPRILRPFVRPAVDRIFPWLVAMASAYLIGQGLMSPVKEELRAVRAELRETKLELVKQNQSFGIAD